MSLGSNCLYALNNLVGPQIFITFVYFLCVYCSACVWEFMWRSEDNMQESVFSFHHVDAGDQSHSENLVYQLSRHHYANLGSSILKSFKSSYEQTWEKL